MLKGQAIIVNVLLMFFTYNSIIICRIVFQFQQPSWIYLYSPNNMGVPHIVHSIKFQIFINKSLDYLNASIIHVSKHTCRNSMCVYGKYSRDCVSMCSIYLGKIYIYSNLMQLLVTILLEIIPHTNWYIIWRLR